MLKNLEESICSIISFFKSLLKIVAQQQRDSGEESEVQGNVYVHGWFAAMSSLNQTGDGLAENGTHDLSCV